MEDDMLGRGHVEDGGNGEDWTAKSRASMPLYTLADDPHCHRVNGIGMGRVGPLLRMTVVVAGLNNSVLTMCAE
jgi:hypothetical protein